MKKLYFLKFGSAATVPDLEKILAGRLDLHFHKHSSSYLGNYLKYSGMLSESLTIGENRLPSGDLRVPERDDFLCIVDVAINKGKNTERSARYKFLKRALTQISELSLVSDQMVESSE